MCLRSPIAVSWLVALASQKVPHRAPTPPDPYRHCPPLINPSKRIPAISVAIWRGSFAEGTKDLGIEYSAIFVQTSNSFIICLCCTQIYEWVSVAVLFLTELCPFLHFGDLVLSAREVSLSSETSRQLAMGWIAVHILLILAALTKAGWYSICLSTFFKTLNISHSYCDYWTGTGTSSP